MDSHIKQSTDGSNWESERLDLEYALHMEKAEALGMQQLMAAHEHEKKNRYMDGQREL